MRASRLLLLAVVALAALPAPATSGGRKAVLLPEIGKNLDMARGELADGHPAIASAYADMVLIGDQVRYFVAYEPNVPMSVRPRSEKSLRSALSAWTRALDESVAFVPTTNPDDAHVTIRFRRDVLMGKEPVAGFANWKRAIKVDGETVVSAKFSALLQIRTINLDGNAMPGEAMTHEVMHEMGHVLGLEDCDQVGEIMGPLDISRPVAKPLLHEVSAVLALRDEARKVKLEARSAATPGGI